MAINSDFTNYIQYPLPFNSFYGVEQPSDIPLLDEQMRSFGFDLWEGFSGIGDTNVGFYVQQVPPNDDTPIIHHLAIYAKKMCSFYIMDYEYYEKETTINNVTIPAESWVLHRRKYTIGAGNKLEFVNTMIVSVGLTEDGTNTVEYFGKNAMLDMCISTIGILKTLYIDGEFNDGIIDPFTRDVYGDDDDEHGEGNKDSSGDISGITNWVSSIGEGVAVGLITESSVINLNGNYDTSIRAHNIVPLEDYPAGVIDATDEAWGNYNDQGR